MKFTYNNSYWASIGMAPYEALYERPCQSPLCWVELEERVTMGSQVIEETIEKISTIKERLKTVQSWQKSPNRLEVVFFVGDFVFLKVSHMCGLTNFGIKGKLEPLYVRPFEIIERIGDIAYPLNLPPQLSHVHNVVHVSMLKKYTSDPSHILPYTKIL